MNAMTTLTEEQQAAADRLRRIWDERKGPLGFTQELISASFGWESQSTVSQYLNGKIPLNLNAVLKFAGALQVPPQEIYPEIFDDLRIPNLGREGVHYDLALKVAESRIPYWDLDKMTPAGRRLWNRMVALLKKRKLNEHDMLILERSIKFYRGDWWP